MGQEKSNPIVTLFIVLVVVVLLGGIFFGARLAIDKLGSFSFTSSPASTQNVVGVISSNGFFEGFFTLILGSDSLKDDQRFVIYLAIFTIVLFTFSDIIKMFSTFGDSGFTHWIIGVALALVLSSLGVTKGIVIWLGITASVGVYTVGVIILSAFFAALVVNIGLGEEFQKWAIKRKIIGDSIRASQGAGSVVSGIQSLKQVDEAFKQK